MTRGHLYGDQRYSTFRTTHRLCSVCRVSIFASFYFFCGNKVVSQNVKFYLELIMFQIMLTIVRNFYHFRFKSFLAQLMQFIIFPLLVVIIKGSRAKDVGLDDVFIFNIPQSQYHIITHLDMNYQWNKAGKRPTVAQERFKRFQWIFWIELSQQGCYIYRWHREWKPNMKNKKRWIYFDWLMEWNTGLIGCDWMMGWDTHSLCQKWQ